MSSPCVYDGPAGEENYVPRRLPPVPFSPPFKSSLSPIRPTSRPLPLVPRSLVCKKCKTCITSRHVLLPPSAYPPNSRMFKGFSGKASLFTETYNIRLSRPAVQLMATGAHTMQEISCSSCSTYLGWKIVRAHESTEKWKEGHCLLELENLFHNYTDFTPFPPMNRRNSSDTEDESGYNISVSGTD